MAQQKTSSDESFSFITGLIAGFIISAPLAAWLSPRSGAETRQTITQQGTIIRRRVGETIRQPVERVQAQVSHVQAQLEQLKGDSVDDALAEGKAIAARQHPDQANKPK
ncbi:MAG: YtxH domain-containing protein [Anaerolineae bacterium]|nr:YtxH domain-containing protein [Anaerolineae bacterium]